MLIDLSNRSVALSEAEERWKEHRIWSHGIGSLNPGSTTCPSGELSLAKSLTSCLICKMGIINGDLEIVCGFYRDQMTS